MKVKCDICGSKIKENEVQLVNGVICNMCARVCYRNVIVSLDEVKNAWALLSKRREIYNETMQIKDKNSGVIGVDFNNKLMTMYPQGRNKGANKKIEKAIEKEGSFIFSFDEITDWNIYSQDSQTIVTGQITSGNHTLSRALVGGALMGPVGAVIGAASSKQTVTNITQTIPGYCYLIIDLNILGLQTYRRLDNPPSKTVTFFNELFSNRNGIVDA